MASTVTQGSAFGGPVNPPRESVVDRFLRYVRVDTQSSEIERVATEHAVAVDAREPACRGARGSSAPSNVRVSEFCMVYATIPSNLPFSRANGLPTIGFLAHVDTSPAVTGANVNPIIHANYQGGDITLPGDPTQVLTVAQNPDLAKMIGDDIITTDGTTLLGSDDKSGVATIMTLVDTLIANPQIPHGAIAIGFTSDEEIGAGIDNFDVAGFGADFAYTVDGGGLGEINSRDVERAAGDRDVPRQERASGHGQGRDGQRDLRVRRFSVADAERHAARDDRRARRVRPSVLGRRRRRRVEHQGAAARLRAERARGEGEAAARSRGGDRAASSPGVTVRIDVKENYKNMNEVLRDHPQLIENAFEATRRAGLEPFIEPIRGGTDGSKLTFRGLPCPNIFTGGYNFHGKLEFNSRRGLEKTTETLVHLVQVFAERRS